VLSPTLPSVHTVYWIAVERTQEQKRRGKTGHDPAHGRGIGPDSVSNRAPVVGIAFHDYKARVAQQVVQTWGQFPQETAAVPEQIGREAQPSGDKGIRKPVRQRARRITVVAGLKQVQEVPDVVNGRIAGERWVHFQM